jgi:hypothetical protein
LTPQPHDIVKGGSPASELGAAGAPELTARQAIEELARVLHSKMEHLDPTDDPSWPDLTDHKKEFYRSCVEEVLLHERLIRIALTDK